MSLVLDASAAVALLVDEETGRAVGEEVRGHRLLAPHLLPFEVLSALRSLDRGGLLPDTDPLNRFRLLQIELFPAAGLLETMWLIRGHVSAYDASYVALARLLSVPLVTLDARLARAAGDLCEVLCPAA